MQLNDKIKVECLRQAISCWEEINSSFTNPNNKISEECLFVYNYLQDWNILDMLSFSSEENKKMLIHIIAMNKYITLSNLIEKVSIASKGDINLSRDIMKAMCKRNGLMYVDPAIIGNI